MLDRHKGFVMLLCAVGACTPDTVPLDGFLCEAGACGNRWVCHPETNLCVRPIAIGCDQADALCPSTVSDDDPCPTAGSFIPCADDVSDCSVGCRTCEGGTWSVCSLPGGCATCTDYFRDDDRDGVGATGDSQCLCGPTAPYDATTGGDCDDSAATGATCTDSCLTVYADVDGDTLGDAAAPRTVCTAPIGYVADDTDCDDSNTHCGATCTDGDSDGWCLGFDCDDGNATCTSDCTACPVLPPSSLNLTVTNGSPINPDDTVNLEIDMGLYTRDVTTELSCVATSYTVFGPHDFTGQPNLGTLGLNGQRESLESAPTEPFDQAGCSVAGDFVQLDDHPQGGNLRVDPALDLRSYGDLELTFVAAAPVGGSEILDLRACCGGGCTLASVQTIQPADISGANACSLQQINIPHDQCSALALRWVWPGRGEFAGVDDISIDGSVVVPGFVAGAPGIYTTSFTAGPPGSFDITCTWENAAIGPSVDDTESITIE